MTPCRKCGSTERNKSGDCPVCKKRLDGEYRQKKKEEINKKAKEYYEKNKNSIQPKMKEWREKNLERKKLMDKMYRDSHKEQSAKHKANHYLSNIDSYKQRAAKWKLENKDRTIEYMRKYSKENPEVRINAKAKRRQCIGIDKLPYGTIPKKYSLQNGKCACCGNPLGDKYHVDHILPLALGGKNTPENIQLLLPRCNQQKSAKHPIDFMQERGFLL